MGVNASRRRGHRRSGTKLVVQPEFEALYREDYPRLVSSLGAAFRRDHVADAVQESFIRAALRWGTVSRLDDPSGWIRRVAVNLLLNWSRDENRRRATLEREHHASDPDPAPLELIDLQRKLRSLPPRMRAAICLHYLADLSVDEVAEALGVATGTVKAHLHQGRQRLYEISTKEERSERH